MNWFSIFRSHYRVIFFNIIVMVYFSIIIYTSSKGDRDTTTIQERHFRVCTAIIFVFGNPFPSVNGNGKNIPYAIILFHDKKKIRWKKCLSQIFCLHLLCHWWILLVFNHSTKVSEKYDMAKSLATFCCSGVYVDC